MNYISNFIHIIVLFTIVNAVQHDEECKEDYVSQALFVYKEKHPTPDILTTTAGKPVDVNETCTLNSPLLKNLFLLESLQITAKEKNPSRVVFPKGVGAHGYFVVTNDVTKYTTAKLFECVGKKTAVLARLSQTQTEKDGSDLITGGVRSLSVKFYTEEGNFDLLSISIPVYFFRDPILFPSLIHAFGRNPKTNINDQSAALDFIIKHPISLEAILWSASEFNLPKGYRYMNAFPIHTYELYNCEGKSYFVKFRFTPELGYESLSLREASVISSYDPNLFIRDLYNAIEAKRYPTWRLEMDVLLSDPQKCDFDPFDVTRLWPKSTYETIVIGNLILNETVENNDAESEKAVYNPSNLVRGILSPLDQLYYGRVYAHYAAQIHRNGINCNKIAANRPLYARTYNLDGLPPTGRNGDDSPNYYPNSFNGVKPIKDNIKPRQRLEIKESNNVDLKGAKHFYKEVLETDNQKQFLVENLVNSLYIRVNSLLMEQFAQLCDQVDSDFGKRIRTSFTAAQQTIKLPNTVNDINNQTLNPYGYLCCK